MRPALTVFLCLQWSTDLAFAWGAEGHMIVAAIAYQKLQPAVRTKVAGLLKMNPNYNDWITGVAAKDTDEIAFITAATWPDAIKSMKGFVNDGEHPKSQATASRNIGYKDKLQHRYWHFHDTPFSADGTATDPPADPSAKSQIGLFRGTLSSSGTDSGIRSYDLVWLIHLVGDVHQPLHATTRFDKDQPDGDEGGNGVKLCSTPKCRSELHGYWDDIPGTSKNPASAKKKALKIAAADPGDAKISDEAIWIGESFQIAQDSVYKLPSIGIGAGPFALTAQYKSDAKPIATKRLALAGARLANLINEALK
jgi:hypothetical protein